MTDLNRTLVDLARSLEQHALKTVTHDHLNEVKRELNEAFDKIHSFEVGMTSVTGDVSRIKGDINHMSATLQGRHKPSIETRLEVQESHNQQTDNSFVEVNRQLTQIQKAVDEVKSEKWKLLVSLFSSIIGLIASVSVAAIAVLGK